MTQRGAAADQADAESLRPISAESSPHLDFPAEPALRDVPKVPVINMVPCGPGGPA